MSKTKKYYVAVDIGCIECGQETHVLGIFTDKNIAKECLKKHNGKQSKDWHGHHSFEVFEIDKTDKEFPVEYGR